MTSKWGYFFASLKRANHPKNNTKLWIEMLALKYLVIGIVLGFLLATIFRR
jgi:type III secretory pathway component EscT